MIENQIMTRVDREDIEDGLKDLLGRNFYLSFDQDELDQFIETTIYTLIHKAFHRGLKQKDHLEKKR